MRDAEKGTIEQSVKNTERRLRCDESRLTPTPRRSRLPLREKKKAQNSGARFSRSTRFSFPKNATIDHASRKASFSVI